MYCPKCGNENHDSNKFCEYCGAPLKRTVTRERIVQRNGIERPNQGTSKGEKILKTISTTLVVLSVLLTISVFLSKVSYRFDIRNVTDDNYWGAGQHWIYVGVKSNVCLINWGGKTEIVPTTEVAETIERLKPNALKTYNDVINNRYLPACGIMILLTLVFYIYIRTLMKR